MFVDGFEKVAGAGGRSLMDLAKRAVNNPRGTVKAMAKAPGQLVNKVRSGGMSAVSGIANNAVQATKTTGKATLDQATSAARKGAGDLYRAAKKF